MGLFNRWLRRTHLEATGEIREHRPWIEDTWRIGPFCLVHWQNVRTPSVMSSHSPRHVWTLLITRRTLRLLVKYGTAPYA